MTSPLKCDDAAPVGVRRREDTRNNIELLERNALQWIAQRRRRYRAVATRPDGKRVILLSTRDRAEAESFVARQRPFAKLMGANIVVEADELHVAGTRR